MQTFSCLVVTVYARENTPTCVIDCAELHQTQLKNTLLKHCLKEPSKQRIKSQCKISVVNRLKCTGMPIRTKPIRTYSVIQPIKAKATTCVDDMNGEGNDSDSDAIIIMEDVTSPIKKEDSKEKPVVNCSIKTKTFRLKKLSVLKKKIHVRSYRCPICKVNHHRLAELNDHYKLYHSPLPCPDCDQEFCTPSSLECHSYKHHKLKFEVTNLTVMSAERNSPFPVNVTNIDLVTQTHKIITVPNPDVAKALWQKVTSQSTRKHILTLYGSASCVNT